MIQFGFFQGFVQFLLTTTVTRARSSAVTAFALLFLYSTSVFAQSDLGGLKDVEAADAAETASLGQLSWRADLFGHTPHDGIQLLRSQILERYGYETECDTSFLWQVHEWNCLAGLQQLLRALENMGAAAQNPEYLGVEEIEIASSWKVEGKRWEPLELDIPYTATAGDIRLWLAFQLQKDTRPSDRRFMATMDQKIQAQSKDLGVEIRIDDDLNPKQIERGLRLLGESIHALKSTPVPSKSELPQSNSTGLQPPRLEPLFDYIVLSRHNRSHEEHHEKTGFHFDVNQRLDRSHWAIKFEFAVCDPKAHVSRTNDFDRLKDCEENFRTAAVLKFREARAELQKLRKELSTFKIVCGETNDLPVEKCAVGAKAFKQVTELVNKDSLGPLKTVVITEREIVKYALMRLDLKEWHRESERLQMSYTANPAELAASIYQVMAQESR